MNEVTRIINAIQDGDKHATEELLPLVYEELRLLAAQKMSQEKPGQTLQATALVHEAYIRLVDGNDQDWNSRGHFFRAAAEAMRRILVEQARKKKSLKRGGDRQKIDLDEAYLPIEAPSDNILILDEALSKLQNEDPVLSEMVKLHCFTGLSLVKIAEFLEISIRTAERDWAFSKAWLYREVYGKD